MSKKIRIVKQGGNIPVHVVARARGKVNHANENINSDDTITDEMYIPADNKSTVDSSTVLTTPKKVSQKEFYTFRDSVFKMIKDSGKNYESLPGNPFAVFSHSAIKDSILKNYRNELIAFKEMVKEYYPEIYSSIQNVATQTQNKTIASKVLDVDVEETLKDVSGEYIRKLEAKEASGATLSKAEKNILQAYRKLQDELRDGAKRQVKTDIMEWIDENMILIVGVIILIAVLNKK